MTDPGGAVQKQTIVVGWTPSAAGESVLEAAIEQAGFRGARLLVVNASAGDAYVDAGLADDDQLALVHDRLAAAGVDHELVQEVGHDHPAEEIIHAAETSGAVLVVIGVRRRTPVGKLLMGSTAQRVLLRSPCAVLAVKA